MFVNGAMSSAMHFALNQALTSRHKDGTEAWARDMAEQINERGGHVVVKGPTDDGKFTYQDATSAAFEVAFGVAGAESLWHGSPPAFCAAFCGATAPVAAFALGDISDAATSGGLNRMEEINGIVDDGLRAVANNHPSADVRAFAGSLLRAPSAMRAILAVPATYQNYQACHVNCTVGVKRFSQ